MNNNVYAVGYLGSITLNTVLLNIFKFNNNVMLTSTNISPIIVKYDSVTGNAQWVKSIINQYPATSAIYNSITGVNNTFYVGGGVSPQYYSDYGNNVFVAGNSTNQNLLLIKYQE